MQLSKLKKQCLIWELLQLSQSETNMKKSNRLQEAHNLINQKNPDWQILSFEQEMDLLSAHMDLWRNAQEFNAKLRREYEYLRS